MYRLCPHAPKGPAQGREGGGGGLLVREALQCLYSILSVDRNGSVGERVIAALQRHIHIIHIYYIIVYLGLRPREQGDDRVLLWGGVFGGAAEVDVEGRVRGLVCVFVFFFWVLCGLERVG